MRQRRDYLFPGPFSAMLYSISSLDHGQDDAVRGRMKLIIIIAMADAITGTCCNASEPKIDINSRHNEMRSVVLPTPAKGDRKRRLHKRNDVKSVFKVSQPIHWRGYYLFSVLRSRSKRIPRSREGRPIWSLFLANPAVWPEGPVREGPALEQGKRQRTRACSMAFRETGPRERYDGS